MMDAILDLSHAWFSFLSSIWSFLTEIFMLRFFMASKISLGCFILHGAITACAAQAGKKLYWYHSLILSIFTSFSGGCLSCMMVGKPPIILVNELIIPGCIVAWYLVQQLGCMQLFNRPMIKCQWLFISSIFRAHGVMNAVDMAVKYLPSTTYPGVPFIGPIIVGTVMGTMGMFFPLDKGLGPITTGMPWPIQIAMLNSFFYHSLCNDEEGIVGNIMRGLLGTHSRETIKLCIITYYVISMQTQMWFNSQANFLTPIHKLLYLIFQVPGPKTEAIGSFWDHKTKMVLESWFEMLRIITALTVLFASIAFSCPSTKLGVNSIRHTGKVIGVCQLQQLTPFAGKYSLGSCDPFHMQFESSSSGSLSLNVYRGQCSNRVVDYTDKVWKLNLGSVTTKTDDVPYIILNDDGSLFAMSSSKSSKEDSIVWKSHHKCSSEGYKSPTLKLCRTTGKPIITCPDGSTVPLK